jgi:hypothetical protein
VKVKDKAGKEVEEDEVDSVRSGVTIPYSPEFADTETNTALLENLRATTGGKTYADDDDALRQAVRAGDVFRPAPAQSQSPHPVWHWLVLAAAILLFFDVAVRRIAVEPAEVAEKLAKFWGRLRGQAAAPAAPQFLDRLRSRKAQVGESLQREGSTRRFDADAASPGAPPPGADEGPSAPPAPPTRPSGPPPRVGPDAAAPPPEDYASRLLRAKKRALGDQDPEGRGGGS